VCCAVLSRREACTHSPPTCLPPTCLCCSQLEKTIYNAILRQMVKRKPGGPSTALPPGIRYHAVMEGVQEHPNNDNTCCEGQVGIHSYTHSIMHTV
jgi:hypothetical protein